MDNNKSHSTNQVRKQNKMKNTTERGVTVWCEIIKSNVSRSSNRRSYMSHCPTTNRWSVELSGWLALAINSFEFTYLRQVFQTEWRNSHWYLHAHLVSFSRGKTEWSRGQSMHLDVIGRRQLSTRYSKLFANTKRIHRWNSLTRNGKDSKN